MGDPSAARGEVCAAPERRSVGGEEHGEWPTARLAGRMQRRHIEVVDVRPLLAVHLDVYEQPVHQRGCFGVLEGFVGHHVAPMTGGVADRQQDRLVARLRLVQRRGAPGSPMHRVIRVLEQVGRGLLTEQVRGLGHAEVLRSAAHHRWERAGQGSSRDFVGNQVVWLDGTKIRPQAGTTVTSQLSAVLSPARRLVRPCGAISMRFSIR